MRGQWEPKEGKTFSWEPKNGGATRGAGVAGVKDGLVVVLRREDGGVDKSAQERDRGRSKE